MKSLLQLFSQKNRRASSVKRKQKKLSLERFENRINMSGFGPEDGAMIVEPWTGSYDEVRIQSSGQIVAAGTDRTGETAVAIARYDSQGEVDASYGIGGKLTPALGTGKEVTNGLALQADGKAIVSYNRTSGANSLVHGVARFNSNGSLDTSFGIAGTNSVDVRTTDAIGNFGAVALQSNGKSVLVGESLVGLPAGTPTWGVVARFNTNGTVDSGKSGFGDVSNGKALGYTKLAAPTSGNGGFQDIMVQPDDKLVVVGRMQNDGSITVARYTSNGKLDTTFNGTGKFQYAFPGASGAQTRGVARQADGKIIVAGYFSTPGNIATTTTDLFVARLNSNGTLDSTFGSGTGVVTWDIDGTASESNEVAQDVVIAPDGKIVVAGYVSQAMPSGVSPSQLTLWRFYSSGALDSTFGGQGYKQVLNISGSVNSVALQDNGDIIVAGSNGSYPMLARFFGDSNSLMSASTTKTTAAVDQVFSSPDAGALGGYLGAWMNDPTDLVTPLGKRKR